MLEKIEVLPEKSWKYLELGPPDLSGFKPGVN